MPEFTIPIKYTSIGDVTIEADTYEEAADKATSKLAMMRASGSIPTDRETISWSGDELEVDSWEVDENYPLDEVEA